MPLNFDGQVAIVTGAGGGLGRSHALALAERGAKVVVNDLGGDVHGVGQSKTAEAVVQEIRDKGGEAIAHGADITKMAEVEDMVSETMKKWGRVDVLVNNAGILRDKSFAKMTVEDFEIVLKVHVMGSVNCTKAVWDIMRDQGYGRIVMTTSSSGLFGNFGQSNYGTAKMALVGLMHTLCLEGSKYDIRVNCLSPIAATRMTENLMSAEVLRLLDPKLVSEGLVYLVSKNGPNRTILSAGAGAFARAFVSETGGMALPVKDVTAEFIAANWAKIDDMDTAKEPMAGSDQTIKLLGAVGKIQEDSNSA